MSTRAAAELFTRAGFGTVSVSSVEAAEVCGALGALYRTIQAAAANELKVACDRMGVDAWEVVAAAGALSAAPTPTIDPAALLSWGARRWGGTFRLLDAAVEINAAMPDYVIGKVADALNDAGKAVRGSKVAILGMAYKKDVDDPRESPSFELLDHLLKKGAAVSYNDPMHSQPLTPEYLAAQDCVLIATDHTAYDYDFIVRHSKLVIDTRNATKAVTKIVRV
ncbi:MAG: hypothetical protein J0I06_16165 [Planctomycetes bacterium]|nr:hypothetical protein [Planctomycetota bacterium]